MLSETTPEFERFRTSTWATFQSLYNLVAYARRADSFVPSALHWEPLFQLLPDLRHDQLQRAACEQIHLRRRAEVERHLRAFFADYWETLLACNPYQHAHFSQRLDQLSAGNVQAVEGAGFTADSPFTWIIWCALLIQERALKAAGIQAVNLATGRLNAADTRRLLDSWNSIRSALAGMALPDADRLGHLLDQQLAAAALVDRSQQAQEETNALLRELLATKASSRSASQDREAMIEDQDTHAIALLVQFGPNAKKIARKMNIPLATLRGRPRFMEHYKIALKDKEIAKGRMPRGYRSGNGDFGLEEGDAGVTRG